MTIQGQINDLISVRASEWVDVLRGGGPADREAFVKWICESPRHLDAYLIAASLDRELESIEWPASLDRETLLSDLVHSNVSELKPRREPERVAQTPSRSRFWRRWPLTAAASAALLAITVGVIMTLSPTSEYVTRTGEQRRIELSDGSLVHLNAESRLEVHMGEQERRIQLTGEALFKVAKDASRPFRVYTEGVTVEAVGTQFNVYARDAQTKVSVLEGRVNVSKERDTALTLPVPTVEPGKPQIAELLSAGEELEITAAGEAIKRTPGPEVSSAISWQQRRRVFEKAPLAEIVAEMNRYNEWVQIRLEAVQPDSQIFSGTFDLDDPYGLAALLAREPGLKIEHRGPEIIVRGAETPSHD